MLRIKGGLEVITDEKIGGRNVWETLESFDFEWNGGDKADFIQKYIEGYNQAVAKYGPLKFHGNMGNWAKEAVSQIPGYFDWEDDYQKREREEFESLQNQAIAANEPIEFSRNYVGCGGRLSNVRWITPDGNIVEGYTAESSAISCQVRTVIDWDTVPPQWQAFFEGIVGGKSVPAVTV
jgi:hypothetical protein